MLKSLMVLISASYLLCASSASASETTLSAEFRRISITPPAPIKDYVFDNLSVAGSLIKLLLPGGGLAADLRARDAAGVGSLTRALKERGLRLEEELTLAVQKELWKSGYRAYVLDDLRRSDRWPDWFEYEKMQFDSDAVLHLAFSKVGVESPKGLSRFYPQIEVRVALARKGQKQKLLDESVHFGPQAVERDREMSVIRDLSMSFGTGQDVMTDIVRLEDIFRAALPRIAKRIVEVLHDGML